MYNSEHFIFLDTDDANTETLKSAKKKQKIERLPWTDEQKSVIKKFL